MKIQRHKTAPQKGFAVLVMLVLLFLMISIVLVNSRTMYRVSREIEMTEKQQMKKYGALAPPAPAAEKKP